MIAIMQLIKNNWRMLRNIVLGLLVASSLSFGIFYHNKANKLSEELKIANNNIEAYQDIVNDSQQASGVLKLDMNKLKEYNDKLIQQIDYIRKQNKIINIKNIFITFDNFLFISATYCKITYNANVRHVACHLNRTILISNK